MLKLVSESGIVIFDSHHEMSGENFSLLDNTRYSLHITNKYCYNSITVEIFKNEKLCVETCIEDGKCACLTFRTGVGDKIDIRTWEGCNEPCEVLETGLMLV